MKPGNTEFYESVHFFNANFLKYCGRLIEAKEQYEICLQNMNGDGAKTKTRKALIHLGYASVI